MAEKGQSEKQRLRSRVATATARVSESSSNEVEAASGADLQQAVGNQSVQRLINDGVILPSLIQNVQRTLGNQAVQRLVSTAIQRSLGVLESTEDLGQSIRAEAGHGQSLESGLRQSLESGLGADLSSVRVHADGNADHLSRAVNAVAFTSGSDIFFRSGAFDAGSASGMHLLAHEATHVVQQETGPVAGTPAPGGVSISDPGDSFERAAEQTATQVTQQMRANSVRPGTDSGTTINPIDDESDVGR